MTWRFSKHPGFLTLGQILWLAQANNCRSTFLCVILVVKLGFWAVLQKSLWDQQILPKIQFFGVYDNSQTVISKNARLFDFRAKHHEVLNHTKHECHFLCTSL